MTTQNTSKSLNLFIVKNGKAEQCSIKEAAAAFEQGAIICRAKNQNHAEWIASNSNNNSLVEKGVYRSAFKTSENFSVIEDKDYLDAYSASNNKKR